MTPLAYRGIRRRGIVARFDYYPVGIYHSGLENFFNHTAEIGVLDIGCTMAVRINIF